MDTTKAMCRNHPHPEWWFPQVGESPDPAKEVCRGCSLKAPCLEGALAEGTNLNGVWGGTSQRERKQILKQRRAAAVAS